MAVIVVGDRRQERESDLKCRGRLSAETDEDVGVFLKVSEVGAPFLHLSVIPQRSKRKRVIFFLNKLEKNVKMVMDVPMFLVHLKRLCEDSRFKTFEKCKTVFVQVHSHFGG